MGSHDQLWPSHWLFRWRPSCTTAWTSIRHHGLFHCEYRRRCSPVYCFNSRHVARGENYKRLCRWWAAGCRYDLCIRGKDDQRPPNTNSFSNGIGGSTTSTSANSAGLSLLRSSHARRWLRRHTGICNQNGPRCVSHSIRASMGSWVITFTCILHTRVSAGTEIYSAIPSNALPQITHLASFSWSHG